MPSRRSKALAGFMEPMQCKPAARLPDGDDWLYELKLDGYRCLAVKNGSSVQLVSRSGKPLNGRFPELAKAVAGLPIESGVIDGEVVMLDAQGRPSFQLLQNSATSDAPLQFYAFDLLDADGADLRGKPLEERRRLLEAALRTAEDPIRFSVELVGTAEQVIAAVTQLGLEGVVAKRRQSLYEPGERSGAWVKFRTNNAQEFAIGGFIPGASGFDALLVGYNAGRHFDLRRKGPERLRSAR